MIKQLKVGKKLFVLAGSLILILLVVAVASLVNMFRINAASTIIAVNWLPSVVVAEELNTMTSDYRVLELSHIISTDASKIAEYDTKIEAKRQEIENQIKAYEPLITNDTDGKMIEEIRSYWNEYITISDQVLELSRKNENVDAMKIMVGDSLTVFDTMSNECLDLVKFNQDGANQASADGDALFRIGMIIMISLLVIAIIFAVVLSMMIIRMIVIPLNQINAAAKEIGMGNLDVNVDYQSQDEVGQIANAFRQMSVNLKTIIEDIRYLLGQMADGNFALETTCEEAYVGNYGDILVAIQGINQTLNNTLSQITVISDQVASSADQLSNGAQMLSQGVTEQASSIEELSASISEISMQVTQNAENSKAASDSAGNAGTELQICNQQMKNMVNAMNQISTKSSEVSKIIKAIEDIAFQTNILALNAAVEAARAGSAGKGFAVVADEVRNLANKSAEAANSTAQLIEETILAVQNGSSIVKTTADSLDESAKIAQKAQMLINQISDASDQQAQSVSQINVGVEQISVVIQSNSATSEESAASSEELSAQAQMLKNLINQFKLRED